MKSFSLKCLVEECDGTFVVFSFAYAIRGGRIHIILLGGCTKCGASAKRNLKDVIDYIKQSVGEEKRIGFKV